MKDVAVDLIGHRTFLNRVESPCDQGFAGALGPELPGKGIRPDIGIGNSSFGKNEGVDSIRCRGKLKHGGLLVKKSDGPGIRDQGSLPAGLGGGVANEKLEGVAVLVERLVN